jgi:hypothetical protein
LCVIKENLSRNLCLSGHSLSTRPEELILPLLQVLGFVNIGEKASEDADTVENITLGGKIGVGERGVIS